MGQGKYTRSDLDRGDHPATGRVTQMQHMLKKSNRVTSSIYIKIEDS